MRSAVCRRDAAALPVSAGQVESPSARYDSAVQTHGMTILVDQFDAIDAVRAARGAADFVHEFEQHPAVYLRGCS